MVAGFEAAHLQVAGKHQIGLRCAWADILQRLAIDRRHDVVKQFLTAVYLQVEEVDAIPARPRPVFQAGLEHRGESAGICSVGHKYWDAGGGQSREGCQQQEPSRPDAGSLAGNVVKSLSLAAAVRS